MLSDAVDSVKRLVNTGVAYRAAHKHHKCNNCGLYGHIAADCMHICAACGGRHLAESCIISIGNQLKTLVDSLCHDFVKDYNRVRKAYLSITNKPVVYTHLVPDSCCRLELEPSGEVKPTTVKAFIEKTETFCISDLWSEQSIGKRLFSSMPNTQESAMEWAAPFIASRKVELMSALKFKEPALVKQMRVGTHTGCDIEPLSYLKTKYNGNQTSTFNAKWYLRVKYKFYQNTLVKNLPVCTIMTGKHLSLDQTEKKASKGLFSKMRSYRALSKDFDEIMRARAKIEDLSQSKLDLASHIEELTFKLNKLKSTYDSKKLKMVEGLKEQTTHIIKKQKDIAKAKLKKVKAKLDRIQEKADAIYASKQEYFDKKQRIKKMTPSERKDFYKNLCADAGITYDGSFYRLACQKCHQLGRIRPSETRFLDPRGMLCESCQSFTFITDYQREMWSQL